MKDYKCFFYLYSEFHVFTRQSSVENCYQRTNYNIMLSNRNDVTPGGIQVPVTHIGQRHPAKTINDSHPLNVFCRTAKPKRLKRFRMSETLPDI